MATTVRKSGAIARNNGYPGVRSNSAGPHFPFCQRGAKPQSVRRPSARRIYPIESGSLFKVSTWESGYVRTANERQAIVARINRLAVHSLTEVILFIVLFRGWQVWRSVSRQPPSAWTLGDMMR